MAEIKVEIAWGAGTFDDPTIYWTNETSRLLALGPATRGVSTDSGSVEPGKLVMTFKNGDRRFEPFYAGSSLYPFVVPRKQVRVSYGANVVWRGYTDLYTPAYGMAGKQAVCVVECIDSAGIAYETPAPNLVRTQTLLLSPSHYYTCEDEHYEAAPAGVYGDATDSSGNGNHGTYNGTIVGAIRYGQTGPNLTQRAFEVAHSLPPANLAYLRVPTYPHSTGDATLTLWARSTVNVLKVFVNQAQAFGALRHFAAQWRPDGRIDIGDSAGAVYTTNAGLPVVNDGSWHQFTFTREAGRLYVKIDGTDAHPVGGWAWATPLFNQTHPIDFGLVVPTSISNVVIVQDSAAPGDIDDVRFAMQGLTKTDKQVRRSWLFSQTVPALYGGEAFFEPADLMPVDYGPEDTLGSALNQFSDIEGIPWIVEKDGELVQWPRNLAFGGRGSSTASVMTLGLGTYQDLRFLSTAQDRASNVRVRKANNGPWADATAGAPGLPRVEIKTYANSTLTQLQDYADWLAASNVPDRLRVGEITVLQSTLDTSALDLYDRITIAWQPPGGGSAISQQTLIVGLSWEARGADVICKIRCNPKWLIAAP